MNSMLDITVIIPCFNSQFTVKRSVESVLSQSQRPKRVILVNDSSTDDTAREIQSLLTLGAEVEISVISNPSNIGPGFSRNKAWDEAKTEWIAFLDADDSWHPRKLELQMKVAGESPSLSGICTQTKLWQMGDEKTSPGESNPVRLITLGQMLFKNQIPTRSVIVKRDIPYRFPNGLSEDFSLWLDCLNSGLKFARIEAPLTFHYRPEFSPGGVSSKLSLHEYYELKNLFKYIKIKPILAMTAVLFSIAKYFRRLLLNQLGRDNN